MTAYRAGQRVRIEGQTWAVEGVLFTGPKGRLFVDMPGDDYEWPVEEWATSRGVTVTILPEPRPDEPTGLGAVVQAAVNDDSDEPRPWVLIPKSSSTQSGQEWHDGIGISDWSDLIDPVVLSEGWAGR